MTIIAYVLTLILALYGLTGIPIAALGILLGRVIGNFLSLLLGGIITWFGINLLWEAVEGGPIPIAALGGAFLLIFIHGNVARNSLNQGARFLMVTEMGSILLIGLYLIAQSESVRWL